MSISLLVLELTIFTYKDLSKNPEKEDTPSEFLSISGDWSELGMPNLDMGVSNEKLLNAAKLLLKVSEHFRETNRGGFKFTPSQIKVKKSRKCFHLNET